MRILNATVIGLRGAGGVGWAGPNPLASLSTVFDTAGRGRSWLGDPHHPWRPLCRAGKRTRGLDRTLRDYRAAVECVRSPGSRSRCVRPKIEVEGARILERGVFRFRGRDVQAGLDSSRVLEPLDRCSFNRPNGRGTKRTQADSRKAAIYTGVRMLERFRGGLI